MIPGNNPFRKKSTSAAAEPHPISSRPKTSFTGDLSTAVTTSTNSTTGEPPSQSRALPPSAPPRRNSSRRASDASEQATAHVIQNGTPARHRKTGSIERLEEEDMRALDELEGEQMNRGIGENASQASAAGKPSVRPPPPRSRSSTLLQQSSVTGSSARRPSPGRPLDSRLSEMKFSEAPAPPTPGNPSSKPAPPPPRAHRASSLVGTSNANVQMRGTNGNHELSSLTHVETSHGNGIQDIPPSTRIATDSPGDTDANANVKSGTLDLSDELGELQKQVDDMMRRQA
ncbi:hypothetical protein PYCC9005_003923 [Savitreella phatthalungensis]